MSWTSPLLLGALLLLPLLWWLMRLLPPAPRVQPFPALMLLKQRDQPSAQQHLPWWLMLLRLLLAALLILGFAGPVWRNAGAPQPATQLTLIIDNGWTAATRFAELRSLAVQALAQQTRADTQVRLLPTAASSAALALAANEWISPAMARQRLQKLDAMPWAANRAALTRFKARGDTLLISDGLDPASAHQLIDWASSAGRVMVREATRLPLVQIRRATMESAGIAVDIAQAAHHRPRSLSVAAQFADGRSASIATAHIKAGQTSARLRVPLAPGERVRIAQLRVIDEPSSGAVHLLDQRRARLYVGIISRDGATPQPLRSADFYVQRALQTHADVTRGSIADLLARGVNLMILPDNLPDAPQQRTQIQNWVAQGGVLLLFAGPRSQAMNNPLLPITLRPMARTLGGAMSWGKAASLGPWPTGSPFAGLPVPADVSVRQQWLAEPSLANRAPSWAVLSDATPLVSAQSRGRGLIILFHTSANADWSNLVLSGLFEQMLVRLLPFATMVGPASAAKPAAAYQLTEALNGYGELTAPVDGRLVPSAKLLAASQASAEVPPGRYEATGSRVIVNSGGIIPAWINSYAGALMINGKEHVSFDARRWLLTLAALLLLIDGLATLYLKGLLRRPRLSAFVTLAATALVSLPHDRAYAAPDGAFDVRLCAVRSSVDADAIKGLQNLSIALKMRTAILSGEPRLVQLGDRELGLCTILYWPLAVSTAALDAASAQRLQRYMAQGGLLFIDNGWSAPDAQTPRHVLSLLQVPPLEAFAANHVLAKSFYLLECAPDGFDFGAIWLESGTKGNDGRTSQILVSPARWAVAWHSQNTPLVQERALRFGINVVIYALTGTYKADQVHATGLLERMARPPR